MATIRCFQPLLQLVAVVAVGTGDYLVAQVVEQVQVAMVELAQPTKDFVVVMAVVLLVVLLVVVGLELLE